VNTTPTSYLCEIKGGRHPTVTLTSGVTQVTKVDAQRQIEWDGFQVHVDHNFKVDEHQESRYVNVGCNVSLHTIQEQFGQNATLISLALLFRNETIPAPTFRNLMSIIVDNEGNDRMNNFVRLSASGGGGVLHNSTNPQIDFFTFPMTGDDIIGSFMCQAAMIDSSGKTVILQSPPTNQVYYQHLNTTPIVISVDPAYGIKNETQLGHGSYSVYTTWKSFTVNCSLPNDVRAQYMSSVTQFGLFYKHSGDWKRSLATATDSNPQVSAFQLHSYDVFERTGQAHLSSNGTSFINLQLKPIRDFLQPMSYVCRAAGLDAAGRHVVLTSPVVVQASSTSLVHG